MRLMEHNLFPQPPSTQTGETGKPLFPPEDTDLLLEVIGATINIEDFKEAKTVEDIMFGGLEGRTKRTSFLHV